MNLATWLLRLMHSRPNAVIRIYGHQITANGIQMAEALKALWLISLALWIEKPLVETWILTRHRG